jgi:hypothetical protein
LHNLEGIYLYDNYLEGKIPRSLLKLPRLSGIYMFSNNLEGIENDCFGCFHFGRM